MRRFIITNVKIFLLVILTLELVICTTGLAGNIVPFKFIKGEFRLMPGAKGTFVKGPFREIVSNYSINKQGFNSILNYNEDTARKKFAIIGDSYIEGLHVNVNESIGRRIEEMSQPEKISIHEYGISGWNVHNFLKIAEQNQSKYIKMYILVDEKDFESLEASMPVKKDESSLKKFLFASHLIRYLYYNRGYINILKNFFNSFLKSSSIQVVESSNKRILSRFPKNSVFMFTKSGLNTSGLSVDLLEIREVYKYNDWGLLDAHWNHRGRLNCATAIHEHISKEIEK